MWTERDERELRRDARRADRERRRQADHTPLGAEPGMTVAEYYGRDQDDQEPEPELRSDGGRELPIGTLVVDRDPADEESGTELVVIDHLDERAADVETVVDANPDVDPDDQVVEAVYVDALDRLVVGWRDMHEQVSGKGFVEWLGNYELQWRVSSPRTRSRR